jgi:MYXO-CTERM domain-containing protein
MRGMGSVRTTLGPAVAAMALLTVAPASANGRFPASNQIVFSPAHPEVILTRTTFALLPSSDNGATWSYLCENALGLPSTSYEDPELAITSSGALVAGLFAPTAGLDVSNDIGCSWSCVRGGLDGQQIADVVVRPDVPHDVLALASTYVDGGSATQVFQSTDDGATWAALGVPIDPTLNVTTIDVAANDPMRIYVAGTLGFGTMKTAWLLVSMDSGAHWVQRPMPFLGDKASGESSVFIGAVDPTDANRVYLRSNASVDGGHSRLFVTTDAGQSFTIAEDFQVEGVGAAQMGEMLGFALSPDGSKIYVGTKESGLWRAARRDLAFTQVNANVGVQCLATRQTATGSELWACGNEYKGPPGNPGNFIVGRSTDDGVTFQAKLPTLTTLKGLAQCGSSSGGSFACGTAANTATSCTCSDYVQFCSIAEVDNACQGCGQDGGTEAGAGSVAGGKVGGSSSSCGCSAVGGRGGAGMLAAAALAAAGLTRRRRR